MVRMCFCDCLCLCVSKSIPTLDQTCWSPMLPCKRSSARRQSPSSPTCRCCSICRKRHFPCSAGYCSTATSQREPVGKQRTIFRSGCGSREGSEQVWRARRPAVGSFAIGSSTSCVPIIKAGRATCCSMRARESGSTTEMTTPHQPHCRRLRHDLQSRVDSLFA